MRLLGSLRWLWAALAAILGVVAYGAKQKREGALQARSDRAAKDAKATASTHQRMNDAPSSDGMHSNDVTKWLRERGRRDSGS